MYLTPCLEGSTCVFDYNVCALLQWGKKKKGVMPYNHQHWYFYMSEYFGGTTCTVFYLFVLV